MIKEHYRLLCRDIEFLKSYKKRFRRSLNKQELTKVNKTIQHLKTIQNKHLKENKGVVL